MIYIVLMIVLVLGLGLTAAVIYRVWSLGNHTLNGNGSP